MPDQLAISNEQLAIDASAFTSNTDSEDGRVGTPLPTDAQKACNESRAADDMPSEGGRAVCPHSPAAPNQAAVISRARAAPAAHAKQKTTREQRTPAAHAKQGPQLGPSPLIAIDGGGTKTEFILLSPDGTHIDSVILGPSNPNACGLDSACAVLKSGITALTSDKGRPTPRAIYAGIAGALSGNNGARLSEILASAFPDAQIKIETDIFNVIASAGITGKCIAAIAGTGSVVYAADGETIHRVGGWGWMFDGAGSGFDIGRDAIRAALAVGDGLTEKSLLSSLVEAKLGSSAWDAISELYKKDREYIASFARCVFDAAEQGDAAALAIIKSNAARLADLIKAAAKQYACGPKVVLSGGLARNAPLFTDAMKSLLGPEFELIIPAASPAEGACRRCLALFSMSNYLLKQF